MALSIHTYKRRPKKMSNEKTKMVLKQINNVVMIIIGSIILAFGTAIFLTKLEIISGGLSGLGIAVEHIVFKATGKQTNLVDIIVFALTWVFWILGLIFIGKEFALKTLVASIAYPLFLALFYRVSIFQNMAAAIAGLNDGGTATAGNYLICGIFGGIFIGGGVAVTFLGGGSTGGVDTLIFLMEKHWKIKESVASFIIDGTVALFGVIVFAVNRENLIPCLCGMVSAFIAALMIEHIYIGGQTSYQVDIISEHWEEISRYAQDQLERGATIIRAEGGYKGEERVILRIVFDKRQYRQLRKYIASVDPKAFVTFTQTNAVYGEGFKKNSKE